MPPAQLLFLWLMPAEVRRRDFSHSGKRFGEIAPTVEIVCRKVLGNNLGVLAVKEDKRTPCRGHMDCRPVTVQNKHALVE